MRARREAMGLSLDQAAAVLGIRPGLIAAIEADDAGALPGALHARLLLRAYARLLDLDADALLAGASPPHVPAGAAHPSRPEVRWPMLRRAPAVSPPRKLRRTLAMAAAAAVYLAVLGYGWMNLGIAGSRTGASRVAASSVLPIPPVPPAEPPVLLAAAPAPAPPSGAPEAPRAAAPVQAPAPRPAERARRVELFAVAETRVQLRSPESRRPILERTLRPGESLHVPDRDWLTLDASPAQNLRVVVNGRPDPAVLHGRTGAVRGVQLTRGRVSLASAERRE